MKILVVGGGVYGISGALELLKRGHQVTVIDIGPIPHPLSASSDISKLCRPDYGVDVFYTQLMEDSLALWKEWNKEFKKEIGEELFHETGLLTVTPGELSKSSFEMDSFNVLKQRGYNPEQLNNKSIQQRYPAWNTDVYRAGYFHKFGGWAQSGKVNHFLAQKFKKLGGNVVYDKVETLVFKEGNEEKRSKNKEEKSTEIPKGQVCGVNLESGSQLLADTVIVAAGAWTPKLLPYLSPFLRPTGHVLFHFKIPSHLVPLFEPPLFPAYMCTASTGFYGFPCHPDRLSDGSGVLKIGNHDIGYAFKDLNPKTMVETLNLVEKAEAKRFRDFISTSWPCLDGAEIIYKRICIYNDSVDSDFLIDHDPDRPGLVLATGGSGHGFKFTPMLGKIIADITENKSNPYASRFAWRINKAVDTKNENSGDLFRNDVPSPGSHLLSSL